MILKIGWKVNLFCFDDVLITCWLKKKYKKVFGVLIFFFENVPLLSISRNSFQTPSLDDKSLENFTLPNSIILVEDLIRWNKGFEIFLIDHYASDIGNKNIAGKYYKILAAVSLTLN